MEIYKILKQANIPYTLENHEAVFTVAESLGHLGDKIPVKNLFLVEEKAGRCVLIIMKGDERLDTKKLALDIGFKKLQFAKPALLLEKLHVTPGSVSLFSIFGKNDSNILLAIDNRLQGQKELGFHPNDNTKTIYITSDDMEKLLDHANVKYQWIDLSIA